MQVSFATPIQGSTAHDFSIHTNQTAKQPNLNRPLSQEIRLRIEGSYSTRRRQAPVVQFFHRLRFDSITLTATWTGVPCHAMVCLEDCWLCLACVGWAFCWYCLWDGGSKQRWELHSSWWLSCSTEPRAQPQSLWRS